jgi:hypothetical protein
MNGNAAVGQWLAADVVETAKHAQSLDFGYPEIGKPCILSRFLPACCTQEEDGEAL